jgi:hypothetical protein
MDQNRAPAKSHAVSPTALGADVRSLDTTPIAPAENRRVSSSPNWNPRRPASFDNWLPNSAA